MTQSNRIYSLDYLRAFVVVLVVVLHGSVAYMVGAPSWWYVIDPQNHLLFTALVLLIDVPIMPIMFFAAGYFALPSLAKRGPSPFLSAKLVRIGIPWVLGVLLLAPPQTYITYLSRGVPVSLAQFWRADFWGDIYQQSVYWFLGVLFFLFVAAAIVYGFGGRFRSIRQKVSMPSWTLFAAFAALMTAAFLVLNLTFPLDSWLKLGYVLVIQPERLPLFFGYFALGVYTYRKGWFTSVGYKPELRTWGLAFVLSGALYLGHRLTPPAPGSGLLGWVMANATLFNVFCLSSLLAGMAVFEGRARRSSPLWNSLAANSYGIYYVHPMIMYPLALILMGASLSPFVKAIAVIVPAGLLSWGLSARVLTKAPILRRMF